MFGKEIKCPVCKFNYVHIGSVRVCHGERVDEISEDGISSKKISPMPTDARGSRIYIEMECEEGHRFYCTIQFYKGQTFIRFDEMKRDEDEFNELWRD